MGTVNDKERPGTGGEGGQGDQGTTPDPNEGAFRVGTKEDTREVSDKEDDNAQEPRDNLRDGT